MSASAARRYEQGTLQGLEEAVALGVAILEEARAGRWEDVPAMHRRFHALLQAIFSDPVPQPGDNEGALALVQRLIALNQSLTGLADAFRSECGDALRTLAAGRRARRAYSAR